ncbi:MAG: HIT domain-containing protein [Candidatus Omnitrophica bacterium]|nr:HIT domain-containing protein [Candidatus Omnitrophota bacterium]MDE2222645.1 HIT domain-containing protein [Candidatus Omnitrophota bacterium]
MQRLWAPWREAYITKLAGKDKPGACVFCRILAGKADTKSLVFIRKPHAYAVLNLYPYSNGHCLIVANRHAGDINQLPAGEYAELMELLREAKDLLQGALKPHGFNVGINLGRTAGAGIPRHVHVHLVPRWKGDHNFMPVTAGTKVISQSLTVIYKKLSDAYKERHRRVGK